MKKRSKKRNKFKKCLLIYSIVLLILIIIFLIYIFATLKEYEDNQSINFIKSTLSSLTDEELIEYLKEYNQSEDLLDEYKKLINDENIIVAENEDSFVVSLDDYVLFNITTKVVDTKTKLGLFSYEVREVEDIKANLDRGLYYYDIIIPSNYTLYINDSVYSEVSSKEEYEDLDFMYVNDSMPYLNTYNISNLSSEASIKVIDEYGSEVKLVKEGYKYTLDTLYTKVDDNDALNVLLDSSVDVSEFAHNWNLYLTKDLDGSNYGYNIIKEYFIEGTDIAKRAYNWAHNIDIQFTSKHTLGDPIWQRDELSNFKVYSKNAFSVEVYLEKVMIVNNEEQVDTEHDTIYYVKYNDTWKVVNIMSGGENNE